MPSAINLIVDSATYLQRCRHGTISTMSEAHELLEVVTATLYRVATYATTHLIEDADFKSSNQSNQEQTEQRSRMLDNT